LLSYIQTIVDEKNQKGMFILIGSHQLQLQQEITQSLAGRTALLTLLPMSQEELLQAGFQESLDTAILKGGYPRIYNDSLNPTKVYRNYFQTYVKRDLRMLINIKDLSQFERFVKLCAGRIGQILNMEEIGGEIGISSHTVKEWISILEASFVVIRLQPYFENFGKRVIKSPKIFFVDTGLAAYLLGIENEMQLRRDPLRGHLVENLVLVDLIKYRLNRGLDPNLYYYRDVQRNEVDIIFKNASRLIPIEVKSAQTFHPEFLQSILLFQKIAKERASQGFLVYAGDQELEVQGVRLVNYRRASQALLQLV
jgi:uncharacterized protein